MTTILLRFSSHASDTLEMSNILSVFNPPPLRDLGEEDCIPCTLVQLVVCFAGGGYFALRMPFQGKDGAVDLKKHPLWFQRGVRGAGLALVALGMFRVGELVQIWYRRR